jgi:hypothetical protein
MVKLFTREQDQDRAAVLGCKRQSVSPLCQSDRTNNKQLRRPYATEHVSVCAGGCGNPGSYRAIMGA